MNQVAFLDIFWQALSMLSLKSWQDFMGPWGWKQICSIEIYMRDIHHVCIQYIYIQVYI